MARSESRYEAFLDGRRRDGLLRDLLPVDARDARTIRIGGETFVNFASNDYLGLRFHPALIAGSIEWGERHGAGAGASRLVTGNLSVFAGIEAKLAKLKRKPSALVMASGFQANAAVLTGAARPERARRRAARLRRPAQSCQHAFRMRRGRRARNPLSPRRRCSPRRALEPISRR